MTMISAAEVPHVVARMRDWTKNLRQAERNLKKAGDPYHNGETGRLALVNEAKKTINQVVEQISEFTLAE